MLCNITKQNKTCHKLFCNVCQLIISKKIKLKSRSRLNPNIKNQNLFINYNSFVECDVMSKIQLQNIISIK